MEEGEKMKKEGREEERMDLASSLQLLRYLQ